jgi:AcrR family transcriptional regulator
VSLSGQESASESVAQKSGASVSKRPTRDERLVRIYHTAAQIFDKKGYDATSLNDIAEAVGLTKAGLYHYIPSKELLLFEVMNYAMDCVDAEVLSPVESIEDPEERLRTLAARYAKLIIERGQQMTIVVYEETGLTSEHLRQITHRRRAFYEAVRDTVRSGQEQGKFPGVDPSLAALCFFGAMMWMAHWYRPDGRLSSDEVVEEIRKLMIDKMLGRSPGLET